MVWLQKDDLTKESEKVSGEWWHQQEEQRQRHMGLVDAKKCN